MISIILTLCGKVIWAWPDPLPILYAGKGLGTNVGFSCVVYSEEGVGLVKINSSVKYSARVKRTASGVEMENIVVAVGTT